MTTTTKRITRNITLNDVRVLSPESLGLDFNSVSSVTEIMAPTCSLISQPYDSQTLPDIGTPVLIDDHTGLKLAVLVSDDKTNSPMLETQSFPPVIYDLDAVVIRGVIVGMITPCIIPTFSKSYEIGNNYKL